MNRKDIIIILIVACVVVFAWVYLSIYQATNSSKISSEIMGIIVPIQPVFDQAVIDSVKGRIQVDPIYQMTQSSASISAGNSQPSLTP